MAELFEAEPRFKEVTYLIEASDAERGYLYNQVKYEMDAVGWSATLGTLDDMPVCIIVWFGNVVDKRVAFWSLTSTVQDYRMSQAFFDKYLPNVPRTDAMNFHQVLR